MIMSKQSMLVILILITLFYNFISFVNGKFIPFDTGSNAELRSLVNLDENKILFRNKRAGPTHGHSANMIMDDDDVKLFVEVEEDSDLGNIQMFQNGESIMNQTSWPLYSPSSIPPIIVDIPASEYQILEIDSLHNLTKDGVEVSLTSFLEIDLEKRVLEFKMLENGQSIMNKTLCPLSSEDSETSIELESTLSIDIYYNVYSEKIEVSFFKTVDILTTLTLELDDNDRIRGVRMLRNDAQIKGKTSCCMTSAATEVPAMLVIGKDTDSSLLAVGIFDHYADITIMNETSCFTVLENLIDIIPVILIIEVDEDCDSVGVRVVDDGISIRNRASSTVIDVPIEFFIEIDLDFGDWNALIGCGIVDMPGTTTSEYLTTKLELPVDLRAMPRSEPSWRIPTLHTFRLPNRPTRSPMRMPTLHTYGFQNRQQDSSMRMPTLHTFGLPKLPKYELPKLPKYELPKLPTYELPKLPKYELPKLPTYKLPTYELPKLPTYELPKLPKYELPKVPTYELPKLPKYELPKLPTYELPKLPTYELPKLPTYELPKLPKYELPKLPTYELPKLPTFNFPAPQQYGFPALPTLRPLKIPKLEPEPKRGPPTLPTFGFPRRPLFG